MLPLVIILVNLLTISPLSARCCIYNKHENRKRNHQWLKLKS